MLRTGYFAAAAGGVVIPPTIAHLGDYGSTANRDNYTYSNAPFGPELPGRGVLAVCSVGGEDRDITTVTIGGVPAIELAQAGLGGSNFSVGIFYAEPAGTSGDVVFNVTSQGARGSIHVYSITDHDPTPFFADYVDKPTNSNNNQIAVDIPANGLALVGMALNSSVSSVTWANADETHEYNFSGESGNCSGAVRNVTDAEAGTVISYTTSSSNGQFACAVSFGPK